MNKIKFLILLFSFSIGFTACDKEQDDLVTANAAEGGLLQPQNASINYIVGDTRTYTAKLKVFQGDIKTTSIDVYKQFKGVLGNSQNILWKTISINATTTNFADYTFDYNELRTGLTVAGSEIPADDQLLSIGDKWILTYVSKTSEGKSHLNSLSVGSTTVAVSTRYAGVYEVIASDYWRIGAQSASNNWVGAKRTIESVDATTYYHAGFGPFAPEDDARAFFYFKINGALDITYDQTAPDGTAVTGLGTYLITCAIEPNSMTNVPCGNGVSDYVVKDDAEGKDILYMSYGYMTTSGAAGPREFHEVLRKIVQ